jgi:prevent-host-death family protein
MTATIISSREFNQNTSAAKKAAEKGPVFITDRGRTAHVLLTVESYEKMKHGGKNILELLAMPEADIIEDFDELIPRSREIARPADFE